MRLNDESGPMVVVIGKQNSAHLEILAKKLKSLGCGVVRAGGLTERVFPLLQSSEFRVVFCDLESEEVRYVDLLETLRSVGKPTKLIVTSRLISMKEYIEAIQVGAYDFLCPPFEDGELSRLLHNAGAHPSGNSERWTVGAA